jgi:hypothetical protein
LFEFVLLSFFQRGTIGEHLQFAARTVVQRTKSGAKQTVGMDRNNNNNNNNNPFLVHVNKKHEYNYC